MLGTGQCHVLPTSDTSQHCQETCCLCTTSMCSDLQHSVTGNCDMIRAGRCGPTCTAQMHAVTHSCPLSRGMNHGAARYCTVLHHGESGHPYVQHATLLQHMPLHDMQQMEFPHTALMQANSTTETASVAFQLCARCGTTLCNSSPSALVSLGLLCKVPWVKKGCFPHRPVKSNNAPPFNSP